MSSSIMFTANATSCSTRWGCVCAIRFGHERRDAVSVLDVQFGDHLEQQGPSHR